MFFKIRIFVWVDMTLTLDLQTLFRITAYVLVKGILWVKYEPDWTQNEKDMLLTRIFHMILQ